MAMDSTSASLACCLLAISFAAVQTQQLNLTITPAETTPGLNLTHTTTTLSSYNSTGPTTLISNATENAMFSSTTRDTESLTTTAATTQSTSLLQTSTLQTDTSLTTTTPAPTTQTTVGFTSTPDTTVITANSSHTGNATTDPTHATTQGLRLNVSEETMTIVFSVVLGVFALALVAFAFHRCKHKIQYFHQPLTDTGDTADAFVADDDTLVISGGLYDSHPIYDNVPTVPADRSQFRLQFLH